jgi:hypothetical protein
MHLTTGMNFSAENVPNGRFSLTASAPVWNGTAPPLAARARATPDPEEWALYPSGPAPIDKALLPTRHKARTLAAKTRHQVESKRLRFIKPSNLIVKVN